MSDDELEKLAAAMKNISPSKAARKSGMEAAMAAFDAEFASEAVAETEAAKEKISTPDQGLANAPRPTGQTTYAGYVATRGRDAMSKIKEFFKEPKAMMMMGTCAAALFATSLYIPNMRFEDMPKPAPQAVSADVGANEAANDTKAMNSDVTSSAGDVLSQLPAQEKSSEIQIVEIGPRTVPVTVPKKNRSGINSIDDLLDEVRADSAKTPTEKRDREAKFRERRKEQSRLTAPMSEDEKQAIREYRAKLQQKDNISLFVDQAEIYRQAKAAEAGGQQNVQAAPAPPMIERQQARKSTERMVPLEGAIPDFAPKIDRSHFKIQVSDRDTQPLVRIPPIIPPRADKSGHCRLRYDVSPEGVPFNVTTTKCTESIFEGASIKSVKKWKYNPKIVNGRAVVRSGVESKVSFRLMDEYGHILPESEPYDEFENFESNPVTSVSETPVSTFSVDVDTASYSFMRNSINRGQLPPAGAVRLEELINYFPYDYDAPSSAGEPFKANVTVTPNPWNADKKLMHIGIKGYVPEMEDRPRSNIVFLIDTSGSMNQANKLPLLISSFKLLLSTLDADDTVSIVTYAGRAGTVLEPTAASEKSKIKEALNQLRSGGSTAGAAGLELAYQKAQESFTEDGNNRVILATDGDFNVGFSSPDEMKTFIEEKRETGIFLSVLGFGSGNYNDHLMQSLAQNGNGVAAYIDTLAEANKVLANEAGSALMTIAKDVKIQVEFNPAKISEYRLIGYETRALKREDFNNDKVDAGEINAGHTVTAIYELTPVGSPAEVFDPLRYASDKIEQMTKGSDEYAFVKIRHKLPNSDTSTLQSFPIGKGQERSLRRASDDMRFAAAVAAFGQKLRGDTQLEDFSYEDAMRLATEAKGEDKHGYRAEFIQLMRLAENLQK